MGSKDEFLVPSWDGEVAGWPEYSQRVRLCYAQTARSKRYTLAPKLVLKLRGKAWEVAASLDYEELSRSSGTQYLMRFLQARLGRRPIPDIGQHLDEVFVRMRRSPGTDLVTWCNQVRETYKKLQRSLAKTQAEKKTVGVQTENPPDESADMSLPTPSTRRRQSGSEPHREPHAETSDPTEDAASPGSQGDDHSLHFSDWDDEGWGRDTSSWHSGSWWQSKWGNWRWHESDEQEEDVDENHQWDDLESSLPQILPEEVLGWILMRRSGLPSASKLSIQAAAGNSLKFSDVEKAMRQQEDELLQQERQRGQTSRHRSYWVEADGAWGLVLQDSDDFDQLTNDQIKWVEQDVMTSMVVPSSSDEAPADAEPTWFNDGVNDWQWQDEEWHILSADGWLAYSDAKPWMDIEEALAVDPSAGKELNELYAAFEQKVRTFKEARDTLKFKGKSRGFYSPHKGNAKGFGKGFSGKGKKGPSTGPAMALFGSSPSKGKGTPPSQRPGFSGCFICGDKGHDFRSCPKRGQSSSSATSSKTKPVCYVDSAQEIFMVSSQADEKALISENGDFEPTTPVTLTQDIQRMVLAASSSTESGRRLGFAVIDTGATETVGSLEAIEHIMNERRNVFGSEEIGVNVNKRKRFRFGNAEERCSESFLILPQTINGQKTSLGVFTLDVPGVPILLGIKTMRKLGAVLNVFEPSLIFTKVFPGVRIPLIRGMNGHLLLNLCRDWTRGLEDENVGPHENLEGPKGVQSQELLSHDVHVIDDDPDTESSCSMSQKESVRGEEQHAMTSSTSQPFQPLNPRDYQRRAESEPTGHGPLPRDLGHQPSDQRGRNDCQVHGDRGPGKDQEELDGPDQVRLDTRSVLRAEGPPHHDWGVSGSSPCGAIQSRKPERVQRARAVAHMRGMQTPSALCSTLGSKSSLSLGRATCGGCQGQAPEGSQAGSERAQNSRACFGSSRGISHATPEGYSDSEGQDQSQGQVRISGSQRHRDSDHRASDSQEEPQERERQDTREAGKGPGGGMDPSQWRVGDFPRLDQDALTLEEAGESVLNVSNVYALEDCQREKIVASLRRAHEGLVDALGTFPKEQCVLLEICCAPNSGLTNKIQEKGGIAYHTGAEKHMDLSTDVGYHRVSRFADELKPDWLWFSIPCCPKPLVQPMTEQSDQQRKTAKKKHRVAKKMIQRSVSLAREQVNRGGHFGWEWPTSNGGWHNRTLKEFFQALLVEGLLHFANLDGCQVGVASQDTGNMLEKRWRIATASKHMAKMLHLQCPGNHDHGERMNHSQVQRPMYYPPKMCSLLSQVVLDPNVPPLHVSDELVLPAVATEAAPLTEQELKRMQQAIRALHVRAGHPTNRALTTMLRARGVDRRMLHLASELQCDDCMEVKLSKPHMGVSFHSCHTLWHTMQMDIGQFVYGDTNIHVLLMIDEASRFASCYELFRHEKTQSRNATTEEIILGIEQTWTQHHELPNVIRCDPEGCFRGVQLEEWASTRGVELAPCPGEDHGQIGIVESTIGKIKTAARALLRGVDCDPYLGILQVVTAHNQWLCAKWIE